MASLLLLCFATFARSRLSLEGINQACCRVIGFISKGTHQDIQSRGFSCVLRHHLHPICLLLSITDCDLSSPPPPQTPPFISNCAYTFNKFDCCQNCCCQTFFYTRRHTIQSSTSAANPVSLVLTIIFCCELFSSYCCLRVMTILFFESLLLLLGHTFIAALSSASFVIKGDIVWQPTCTFLSNQDLQQGDINLLLQYLLQGDLIVRLALQFCNYCTGRYHHQAWPHWCSHINVVPFLAPSIQSN